MSDADAAAPGPAPDPGAAPGAGPGSGAGAGPGREEIVAILAAFGDRPAEEVPEGIDSMELAWLVHQIEQRYGDSVDDEAMSRMTTVSAALQVLTELHGEPAGSGGAGAGPGTSGGAGREAGSSGAEAGGAAGVAAPGGRAG